MNIDSSIEKYHGPVADRLQDLRSMIHSVAQSNHGIGEIEECLKWGQPSFVTKKPKSGSTIRIDGVKDSETKYAMYFICNTNLVERFRERYPDTFHYEGNRAIVFDVADEVPEDELRHCIAMALTYHL